MTRAELAALVGAMTEGPWFYRENSHGGCGVNRDEKRVYSVEILGDGRGADCRPWFEGCGFKRWSSRVIATIQDWTHWTDHPANRDGIIALRNRAEKLLAVCEAAERLHNECCDLPHGKRLNVGPMLEPSEAAVLELRAALRDLEGA